MDIIEPPLPTSAPPPLPSSAPKQKQQRETKRYRFVFTSFGITPNKSMFPHLKIRNIVQESDPSGRRYVVVNMDQPIRRTQLARAIHVWNERKINQNEHIRISTMPGDDDEEDLAHKSAVQKLAARIRVFGKGADVSFKDSVITGFIEHKRESVGGVSAMQEQVKDARTQVSNMTEALRRVSLELGLLKKTMEDKDRKHNIEIARITGDKIKAETKAAELATQLACLREAVDLPFF